jgi:RTX calcium-binding nonapeptide repeat (4 copies)
VRLSSGSTGDMRPDRLLVQGTGGPDSVRMGGSRGALELTGLAASVGVTRADPADVLAIDGLDGDDAIDARELAAGTIALELHGGARRDMLLGSDGDDRFTGGEVVEGQLGHDELAVSGSDAADAFAVSANGQRGRLVHGATAVDFEGVERLATSTLGGADTYRSADLTGTALLETVTDLGSGRDRVIVDGSTLADDVEVTDGGVMGLWVSVRLAGAESLTVNGMGGDDRIDAAAVGALELVADGGDGHDDLVGGRRRDVLRGGDGADRVDGNQGDDVAHLGAENDMFRWDAGDGSDRVEAESGRDDLSFNGSAADEAIGVSASGQRLRLQHSLGAATMDADGFEQLTTRALGGADAVTVGDLTGTVVAEVDIGLAGVAGASAGDGRVDSVTVTGTDGVDAVRVGGATGSVFVGNLAAAVGLFNAEPLDRLTVDTRAGDDIVNRNGLAPGTIALSVL